MFWVVSAVSASACLAAAPMRFAPPRKPSEGAVGYPAPKRLELFIGGALGPSYRVRWDGKSLLYTAYEQGHDPGSQRNATFKPTKEQWIRFWKDMQSVKLWQWRARYEDTKVLDGTHWSLDIAKAGKSERIKKASGSNSYPGDVDVTHFTSKDPQFQRHGTFARYLKAVERLLEGRHFH